MSTKFKPNKTYWTRSVCDHNCIIRVRVARRTAKTIVTDPVASSPLVKERLRIQEWDGIEYVMPWGRFSMAPIASADCAGEGPL